MSSANLPIGPPMWNFKKIGSDKKKDGLDSGIN